jgi:hypothetical protein
MSFTTNPILMAAELTPLQRNFLIKHIDGSGEIPVPVFVAERKGPRAALIARGLLKPNRPNFASKTLLTEKGRAVLAIILGEYADALVRAGFTGVASPLALKPRPLVDPAEPIRDETYEDEPALTVR